MAIDREAGTEFSGLARVHARDRAAVLAFLRQAPARNAYLLAQVSRGSLSRDDVAGPMLGHWEGGYLDGIAIFGSNLVLSSPCSTAARESFARYARSKGFRVWVVVGEDATIDAFMDDYGRHQRVVARERAGQRLYALRHPPPMPVPASALRCADIRETEALMRMDRAMVEEELGFDPFARDVEGYRRGWKRRVRERRTWVVERRDELIFKVDHSASSEDVVQLAGVYTLPSHRRQGIARAAMAAMCLELLHQVPVVTLYVEATNTPAIRLYESLGFEHLGFVRSIWFEP